MNAVMTISMGEAYQRIAAITHPSIKAYADKIGADFVVIDKQKVSETSAHYEKFQIYDLLNKYSRIIYIDTDAIVRPDCPSLFDVVSHSAIGMFDEGAIMDRTDAMRGVCKDYGEEIKKWDGQYYNTGVMVVSRIHKQIFKKPPKEAWNFYEQSYINLRVIKGGVRVHPLDQRFNRMSCMDKVTGEHRLRSHIVHYAGVLKGLDWLIPDDLRRWASGEHERLRRNVVVGIGSNRLGDNICSEPVARYIVGNSDVRTDFSLLAVYPQVFRHLEGPGVRVMGFDDMKYEPDKAYLHVNLAVDEKDPLKKFVTCDTMNMTDFTSIAALRRVLPDDDRRIRLPASAKGLAELVDIAGDEPCDFSKLVVVHPGRAWPSKTFPKAWWDEVIGGISKERRVAIIGADTWQGQGTVDVAVPRGAIDFRNILSLDGMFTLLSVAPLLVTNDSGPLHAAGAFDNEIIVIPTCKHPDLIMPWRYGSKYFKAKALYARLICDAVPLDLSNPGAHKLHELVGDIMDYLPPPSLVIMEAIRASAPPTTPTAPVSSG